MNSGKYSIQGFKVPRNTAFSLNKGSSDTTYPTRTKSVPHQESIPLSNYVLEVNSLTLVVGLVDSNMTGKTRVSAYKGDTADDISKPSIFLCRHRTISTSESRLTTYYSSHILSMHLRVVYAVTKSISSLIFISLRLRSARTETRSTI